jgi:hypothetical protein
MTYQNVCILIGMVQLRQRKIYMKETEERKFLLDKNLIMTTYLAFIHRTLMIKEKYYAL